MKVLNRYMKRLVPVGLVFALVAGQATVASAATLTNIKLVQDNPNANATTVNHTFTFSNVTTNPNIQCITVNYSQNGDGTGGAPAGLNAASAALDTGSDLIADWSGWSVTNVTGGVITIKGGDDAAAGTGPQTLGLDGITNGNAGPYFATVKTFSDSGCTTVLDQGVIAGEWESSTDVYVAVDPTLTFTVTNDTAACNGQDTPNATPGASATSLNLGRVNATNTAGAAQLLSVVTNAANGWTVTVQTDLAGPAMRDGAGHSINDVTTGDTIVGADGEKFGFTSLKQASGEFEPLTASPQVIADQADVTPCIGYQVSVAGSTEAGRYAAKAIYTAIPVF